MMRYILLGLCALLGTSAIAEEITVEIVATINKFDESGKCCLVPVIGDMVLGDEVRIQVTYDFDAEPTGGTYIFNDAVSLVSVEVEDHFSAYTTTSGTLFNMLFSLQANAASTQGGLTSDVVFVGGGIDEYRSMVQLNVSLYNADGGTFDQPGLADISSLDISNFGDDSGDNNFVFLHFGDGVRAEAVVTDVNYIPQAASFSGVKISVNPFTNGEVRPLFNDPVYAVVHTTSIATGDAIDFNPNQLDWDSVRFGPDYALATGFPWVIDVDEDGDVDAVFAFDMQDSEIACGDTEVNLLGANWQGEFFESSDTIATVDCETTACHSQ